MSKYKMRVVEYRDVEVLPEALVTVTEAARMIGITKAAIVHAIERGALTEIVDTDEGYRGRRLLRHEVERMARARASESEEESEPLE